MNCSHWLLWLMFLLRYICNCVFKTVEFVFIFGCCKFLSINLTKSQITSLTQFIDLFQLWNYKSLTNPELNSQDPTVSVTKAWHNLHKSLDFVLFCDILLCVLIMCFNSVAVPFGFEWFNFRFVFEGFEWVTHIKQKCRSSTTNAYHAYQTEQMIKLI